MKVRRSREATGGYSKCEIRWAWIGMMALEKTEMS